jgi:hypothetical protein
MREEEKESKMDTGEEGEANGSALSLAKGYVALAQASVAQANVYFTHYCLKKISQIMGGSDNAELTADRESIKSRVAMLNFATAREDLTAVDNFCSLFRSWVRHVKPERKEHSTFRHHRHDLLYKDVMVCLSTIVEQNSQITPSQIRRQLKAETDQQRFDHLLPQLKDSHEAFRQSFTDKVLGAFEKLRHLDWGHSQQKLGGILLEGANYIHNLLQKTSDANVTLEAFVDYQLSAMKVGSMVARELFPRLLPLLAARGAAGQYFMEQQAAVPAWMFLAWSNQLISCLHNDQLNAYIFPLTMRIAAEYPNAVLYSVEICAESAADGNNKKTTATSFVARLKSQLPVSPVHRQLLKGLARLAFPHIGLKDLVDGQANWQKWHPDSWQEKYKAECELFRERFLSDGESQGKLHQQFAKEYGAKLKTCDIKAMKAVLETQAAFEKKHPTSLLKDFSPFLANFQGADFADQVEIPGQYGNMAGRPDPRQHATLAEFVRTVTVFSSIRRPMLVRMVGSDGRTYPFIVKAGEDLRQDQRIEQLFEICNRQLAACGSGHVDGGLALRMQTYSVVPLSKRLGLIQYVGDTLPLRNFINLSPAAVTQQEQQAQRSYISGMQVR